MKILVFTEGTILVFQSGKNLSREERVELSRRVGIQREESTLAFENNKPLPDAEKGSVYDYASYVPIGNAVEKLARWKQQGATICYLTSRRIKEEVETNQQILEKHNFPDSRNIYFRKQGENYKDVAERLAPDVLIEDDCESIGGENEMTYPSIKQELKGKIKSVVVKEFSGIDNLPDDIVTLQ